MWVASVGSNVVDLDPLESEIFICMSGSGFVIRSGSKLSIFVVNLEY
jgi:hypothetical protein